MTFCLIGANRESVDRFSSPAEALYPDPVRNKAANHKLSRVFALTGIVHEKEKKDPKRQLRVSLKRNRLL